MSKLDFKKSMKALFNPKADAFVEVNVPELSFVKIDGTGDPNTAQAYLVAVQWLYGVSYAMKFASKNALDRDYVVPPLRRFGGQMILLLLRGALKDQWRWTVMIMVPEFVTDEMFARAAAKTEAKRDDKPESLRFETSAEGRSLQILHIGSYDDEGPTLSRLHDEVMPELGVTFNGPHHEIYLSDPRRVKAEKLRTILRQPVLDISGV